MAPARPTLDHGRRSSELVHHDEVDIGVVALAQGSVGEDLAVQTITGASLLTAASPVTMPTLSAPRAATISKNFSLTSALMGAV